MQAHVFQNGELLCVDEVNDMVKKFEEMNWIEQQTFLLLLNKRLKHPPNNCWTKKIVFKEIPNKEINTF